MNPITHDLQRSTEIFIAINLLAGIAAIALWIWISVWIYRAFQRWEARENAKVKALQRIAANSTPNDSGRTTDHLPPMRAER